MNKAKILSVVALFIFMNCLLPAAPLGAAFTYQGKLADGTNSANGSYDLKFTLYDSATGPTQVGIALTNAAVAVSNGYFTVKLDFGATAFNGEARWLEVSVRTNGPDTFALLNPRQPLTPSPYAIYASGAVTATTVTAGSISNAAIAVGAVNSSSIQDGTITSDDIASIDAGKIVGGDLRAARLNVGMGHILTGIYATIAGGTNNTVSADYAAVGGGEQNSAAENYSAVGGGRHNSATGIGAFIGGGAQNIASGLRSCIGGGWGNTASNWNATVAGGSQNTAGGDRAAIGGGWQNFADGDRATVAGGYLNQATNSYATIGGGQLNAVSGFAATVSGGATNTASGDWSVVGGGLNNLAEGLRATVGGGWVNLASNVNCTIAGGRGNVASGWTATVGGGDGNTASAGVATVSGGAVNTASGGRSYVGGGRYNAATTNGAVVVGGNYNSASNEFTFVGGGSNNVASGWAATVPGGYNNIAAGDYSFAVGNRAQANHRGAFVWTDSQEFDYSSYTNDQVIFRCTNGVTFTSGSAAVNQTVSWKPGSASWSFTSDRDVKEGFQPIDAKAILEKLSWLPITEWNYKGFTERHIGPMAQDFHDAFPLNESDTTLNDADLHGVALAAIKGLNQKLEETRAELKRRDAENAELKARLERLERLLSADK